VSEHPIRAALAGILLVAIGLAIGGGALQNYWRERERLQAWARTEGEVVQLLTASGGARPIVGFTTSTGDRIRFTALNSAARIDSPVIRWARSVYAAAGAVALVALGAYLTWYARRRDAQMPASSR
jgi:hypothetical protein